MMLMAKLMFNQFVIGFGPVLALGPGVGASHIESPAALHYIHHHTVQQKLRNSIPQILSSQPPVNKVTDVKEWNGDSNVNSELTHRYVRAESSSTEDEDCPGTPFLWKITEDDTGKHVGFGLGTMHLPANVVTTPSAYASIKAAIEDSCDVYGELNPFDDNTMTEMLACIGPLYQNSATVADIPDEELRESFNAKVLEIATMMANQIGNADYADVLASDFLALPLSDVQNLVLFTNTPEYRDQYLQSLLSGGTNDALDFDVLLLGRTPGGLEEVSTQCEPLEQIYITAEDLNQNFDLLSPGIKDSLNATLTNDIETYKCGVFEAFVDYVNTEAMTYGEEMYDLLLTDRNVQMAAKMNGILKANPDERILFAVGAAHWNIGAHSLETLLKDYGYALEHIPNWDVEHAENHSDQHCQVVFNNETGLFVPAPNDGGFTSAPTPAENAPSNSSVPDDDQENSNSSSSLMPSNGNQTQAIVNSSALSNSDTAASTNPTLKPSSPQTLTGRPTPFQLAQDTNSTVGPPNQDTDNDTDGMPSGESTGEGVLSPGESSSGTIAIGTSGIVLVVGGFICLMNLI